MRLEVLCTGESLNPYTSKTKGPQVDLVVGCLDQCPSRQRLEQTFDLIVPDEERTKFAGKILDHRMTIDILKAEWFNQRLRTRGVIVAIDGKPVNGNGNGHPVKEGKV